MRNHHQLPAPGPACSTFAPLLPLAAHGLLGPEKARQLQGHLAGCANCQSRQAAYGRMDAALRRHFERKGSGPLRTEEILGRIRAEGGLEAEDEEEPPLARPIRVLQGEAPPVLTLPPMRRPRRGLSWAAAVAAVLVIVLITTGLVASHHIGSYVGNGQATTQPTISSTKSPLPTPTLTPAPTFTPTPGRDAAHPNPYPPYTGMLVWNDPLTSNNQGHQWDGGTYMSGQGCRFSGGSYQVETTRPYSQTCFESARSFTNFTLQVDVTFLQISNSGDGAAILFRGDPTNLANIYDLVLSSNGNYALAVCAGNNCSQTIFQGTCQICHVGSSQSNTLAIVAAGTSFTFYANGQQVASGTDATYSQGEIGFQCYATNSTTIMAFKNLKIWQQ